MSDTPIPTVDRASATLERVGRRIDALEAHANALLAYQKASFRARDSASETVAAHPPAAQPVPMANVLEDADGFDQRFLDFAASEESHDENSRRWLLGG